MDRKSSPIEPLAKRVAYFRRLFAKGIGRTPTALQKHAVARAAQLSAEAERALADPAASINDKVRIDHAAARARADMAVAIAAGKPKPMTLPDLLRQEQSA